MTRGMDKESRLVQMDLFSTKENGSKGSLMEKGSILIRHRVDQGKE